MENAGLLRVVHKVSFDAGADLSGVTVIVDVGVLCKRRLVSAAKKSKVNLYFQTYHRSRTDHREFDVLISVLFSNALHVRIDRRLAGRVTAGPGILRDGGQLDIVQTKFCKTV